MLSFTISLPENTKPEVIEWFEFMNGQCALSSEVIKLVLQNLASQLAPLDSNTIMKSIENIIDDPLDNLFNWQDSGSTLFCGESKQKKKMLIV